MQNLLSFLTVIAIIYIVVMAFKYVFRMLLIASIVLTGSTIAYVQLGQSAMLQFLILSPVLYILVTDFFGTICSVKLPEISLRNFEAAEPQSSTDLVETTLTGEWISGKTPAVSFQQPLIGELKRLPKPWL